VCMCESVCVRVCVPVSVCFFLCACVCVRNVCVELNRGECVGE
jgi:hypothetical protein